MLDGDNRLTCVSEPDSLQAAVTISKIELDEDGTPVYTLKSSGQIGASPLPQNLTMGIDGSISWKSKTPMAVGADKLTVKVGDVTTVTSLQADFTDGLQLDQLDFEVKPLRVDYVANLVRSMPEYASMVPEIATDATVTLKAHLRKPYFYNLVDSVVPIPAMDVALRWTDCPVSCPTYDLDITNLGMEVNAKLSDGGLDASTVEVKRIALTTPGTDFTLEGSVTNLLTDPLVDGCLKGTINFSNLSAKLWALLGMKMRGTLDADFDFTLHQSDMDVNRFHRVKLTGDATMRDFYVSIPSDTITAGIGTAMLHFGSSTAFVKDDVRADSLLTASLKVDTAWVNMAAMDVNMSDVKLGVGCENRAASADTTTVTPMGASLNFGALRYKSTVDSMRFMLRHLEGGASLRRYKGAAKVPELTAHIGAQRLVYGDGINRMALRDSHVTLNAHLNQLKRRTDSVANDTAKRAEMRRRIAAERTEAAQYENIDFAVDRSTVRLLRRWSVTGTVSAKRGRVMTPLFPLRTRLSNFNMQFNPDSIVLRSLSVKCGHSDFLASGMISNMQRALGSRHKTSPLHLEFKLRSDTIDIDELTNAAFRGAAFSAHMDSLMAQTSGMALDAGDDAMQSQTESVASDDIAALVVPMNVDADFTVYAENIIYSDLLLQNFAGQVLVSNGAINLSNLSADSDLGSAQLNALYYAPTRSDIDFGLGVQLNRFHIDRVTELLPAVDSLMPILHDLGGIIDVSIGATTKLDSVLNFDIPSTHALVRMSGDSLKVIDEQTFKTMSKWLLFKDKKKNMIDHMEVQMAVENSMLQLYPFMFDFDRYRIGVMGHNDMDMNLNYHVSILKSPIPFKFGINVKGNTDKMKIRLGRARFKENMVGESTAIADTVRINLIKEIQNVFRRGKSRSSSSQRLSPLQVPKTDAIPDIDAAADTFSAADSLYFIENGLIEASQQLLQQ
jgi:hypothetical protein